MPCAACDAARWVTDPLLATQVMHVCWLFLCDTSVRKKQLQELDALALLLAALTHDLEHPGLTNAYQVNTASALALRYNDASVLENHHCSCAFASFERAGILKGLEPADLKALRKLVVASILATDMCVLCAPISCQAAVPRERSGSGCASARPCDSQLQASPRCRPLADVARVTRRVVHKDLLARVTAQVNGDAESSTAGFSREVPEHRELLVSFLLHAADLCCPLFPPAMSRRIADSLSTEFERQAGLERAEALPVTVPVAKDEGAKGRMELGFIDFGAHRSRQLPARCQRLTPQSQSTRSGSPAVSHAGGCRARPWAALPVADREQPQGVV